MAKTLRLNVLGPFHAQWSDGTLRRSYGPLISSNGETLALNLVLRDALVAVV